jgi:hypothetical protein
MPMDYIVPKEKHLMAFSVRKIHFDPLVKPEASFPRNPHGVAHANVEISTDYFKNSDWITLRAEGREIDLSPDEQQSLIRKLISRFPLDAMSGI